MNKPFHVGEVAILINAENFPEYNNQECVITQPLLPHLCCNTATMQDEVRFSYVVRMKCDNMKLNARPDQLKPRVGPEELKKVEEEVA